MANPNVPWGMQPYQRKGSASYRANAAVYSVPANTTNALYVGDPVIKLAASADANGYDGINLASAGTSNRITGVIVGWLGSQPTNQVFSPNMFGASGSPGPMYKPANASLVWYALVDDDPGSLYVIQSNDSGGAPAATVVGKNANLASGTGSAFTGWSGWQLAANQIAATSTYQLAIVGFEVEPDNVPGQTHAKLIVRINQTTEGSATTGI